MFPVDIRQSDEWASYLEFLGWQKIQTSNGVNAAMLRKILGKVIKVQRPQNLKAEDLDEIEKTALENKISLIKVEPSLEQDLEILKQRDYIPKGSPLSPPATIFIDLRKSQEELWSDLSNSCKYSIHRAQREGAKTEFTVGPSEEKIKQFYKIHFSTGKQKAFYIQEYKDIQKKVELFGKNAILGIVRSKEGDITGANLYLGFKEGIWYMHGGTTEEGRKTKNGYMLYWQSILYFKNLGYAWLDLEGVDDARYPLFTKKWGGISHFKEKFGGIRVEFPAPQIKIFSPWMKKISTSFDIEI